MKTFNELNKETKNWDNSIDKIYGVQSANGLVCHLDWMPDEFCEKPCIPEGYVTLTEYLVNLSKEVYYVVIIDGFYHWIQSNGDPVFSKAFTEQYVVTEVISEREYAVIIRVAKVAEYA